MNAPIKANAPGRLDFYLFIEKRPGYAANAPGRAFSCLFERKAVGRAHDTRRCAKRTCCRSVKGRFAACSGRNSTDIFFLLDQWTQHVQTNIFFVFENAPEGAFCLIFVLKNAPGTLQAPRRRYFGTDFIMERPGGRLLRSLRYVVAFCLFLLLVLFLCFCVSLIYFYFYFCLLCAPSWRRCPLLGNSLSVVFCLLSLLFSERVSGLIWFGSVYLVTTAGFVADQLM